MHSRDNNLKRNPGQVTVVSAVACSADRLLEGAATVSSFVIPSTAMHLQIIVGAVAAITVSPATTMHRSRRECETCVSRSSRNLPSTRVKDNGRVGMGESGGQKTDAALCHPHPSPAPAKGEEKGKSKAIGNCPNKLIKLPSISMFQLVINNATSPGAASGFWNGMSSTKSGNCNSHSAAVIVSH